MCRTTAILMVDSCGKAAALLDLSAKRSEYIFKPPEWARCSMRCLLNDPRDEPVVFLFLNILTLAVPAAATLFLLPPSHVLGAVYLAINYAIFVTRFLVALLHVTEHRRLFNPEFTYLNMVAVHLLAPLYGVPSGLYMLHHRVMHHAVRNLLFLAISICFSWVKSNMPIGENTFSCMHDPQEGNHASYDLSSTEPYQRDNLFHFLMYWVRHAIGAWVELLGYALWRRRFVLFVECLSAETAYIVAVYMLWQWRPVATLWTLVLPYFLSSLALMFGNWSQHIFIDPDNPSSAYGMAYNCVACPDNAITFNDGYHIQHHLNSKSHWSELPTRFLDTFDEHARQQALVFQKIGVFEVGLAVFLGRFEFLVQHMLICGQPFASMDKEALIGVLKSRLKPIRR